MLVAEGSKDDCVPVNTELLPQQAMTIKSGFQSEKSDKLETFFIEMLEFVGYFLVTEVLFHIDMLYS